MRKSIPKIKTSITLDQELIQKMKAEAKRQRRSVSQLMTFWIEDCLAAIDETAPEPQR